MSDARDLWIRQLSYASQLCDKLHGKSLNELTDEERVVEIKEYGYGVIREMCEVIDTFQWKRHRGPTAVGSREEMLEEFIDVQKYLWGAMQVQGITYEEFLDMFEKKTAVVEDRFEHEMVR